MHLLVALVLCTINLPSEYESFLFQYLSNSHHRVFLPESVLSKLTKSISTNPLHFVHHIDKGNPQFDFLTNTTCILKLKSGKRKFTRRELHQYLHKLLTETNHIVNIIIRSKSYFQQKDNTENNIRRYRKLRDLNRPVLLTGRYQYQLLQPSKRTSLLLNL